MHYLSNYSVLLIAFTLLYGCMHFQSQMSKTLESKSIPTDPGMTETPYHPFRCIDGDYISFSFGKPAPATIADFGFAATSTSVIGLPKLRDILAANEKHNLQLDFCFNDDDVPELQRITSVFPNVRIQGPFGFSTGTITQVFVIRSDGKTGLDLSGKWGFYNVPRTNLRVAGLQEALFGDASTLKVEGDYSDQEKFVLRAVKKDDNWVTGFYHIARGVDETRVKSSYLLTGALEVGSKFGSHRNCPVDFEAGVSKFTIGTARFAAQECSRSIHTSGSNTEYSYYQVEFEDQNPQLPEVERKVWNWEKDGLNDHVWLNVIHHNWNDTLVVRLPSAVYACFLSRSEVPGVKFPSDIPQEQFASRESGKNCLVQYGGGAWTPVELTMQE